MFCEDDFQRGNGGEFCFFECWRFGFALGLEVNGDFGAVRGACGDVVGVEVYHFFLGDFVDG